MDMIERVARAIKWARIKDEFASKNYATGETEYMRDICNAETVYIDGDDMRHARAAIEAMRPDEPSDILQAYFDAALYQSKEKE